VGEYRLLRTLIDLLPDRLYMKDLQSRFIVCNKATANHGGLEEAEDLIGKKDSDIYVKEAADKYIADEQLLIKTGKPFIYINERNLDKAGNEKWSLTTKMPLKDRDGKIVGLIGIGRDITDLKESEKYITKKYFSLQSNRSFNFKNILQNIVENSTDSICIKDRDGRYILLNKNHSDWLGATGPEEVMGKADSDFLPAAQAEQIKRDELRIIGTQKPVTYEETRTGPDGKSKWILTRKYPFYDEQNRIIGVFALSRDITHYKHMEKSLRGVNRQKTRFFINLAHETKTPLTLIKNCLEKLHRKNRDG
jgi:PAS domain S-box-containing protein